MFGRNCTSIIVIFIAASIGAIAQLSFSQGSADDLRTAAIVPPTAAVIRPPAGLIEILRANSEVRIVVPTADGSITLVGKPFDLFTPDAVMMKRGYSGDELVEMPRHALMSGFVEGHPGSSVFFAAFETHVIAMIEFREPGGKRRFLISPDTVIPGSMANHVYHESRAGEGSPKDCYAETLPNYQQQVDSIFQLVRNLDSRSKKDVDRSQDATPYALQFALDCTLSFYTNLGSNLTTAASSAIAITGAAALVYQRDANVMLRVPYLRVWTVADPYPGDIGSKLNKTREHWEANMTHVSRSITCLLSGEGGGGLAWVGVLCGGYGYNVSGVDGRVNFPASGYVWDIDVTSHELGHNIGSSHTQNCGWNPPIDSCWNAEGGCYESTRPQRGTIMSYCHLVSKGTELQFHPRVASLFNRVLANSNCTAPVPSQRDTDVAVVNIQVPANGGVMTVRQSFTPSIHVRNLGRVQLNNVPCSFTVTDRNNVVKKTVSVNITRIDPGETLRLQFAVMTFDTASDYLAVARVLANKDQHATNDIMTRPFAVGAAESGAIVVVSPNGGETVTAGTPVTVKYTATGVARVMFELSTDDGATWTTLQHEVDGAAAEMQWNVPWFPSSKCRIRASSLAAAQINDASNATFTIAVPVDIHAYDIAAPIVNATSASPISPRLVIRNPGLTDVQNVNVRFSMRWVRSTTPSVDTSFVVPLVRAGAMDTISLLATPMLANGVHVMEFVVAAPGDNNPANDRFGREFTSTGISPPSDIRFEEGPSRILLQWMLREDNENYRVELWRGNSVDDLRRIRTFKPSVTSFVDDGLMNDTAYIYALRTVDGLRRSVFSPNIVVRPTVYPAGVRLSAPSLISPSDGLSGVQVPTDLVWSTVVGGDQYEVQVAEDAAFQNLEFVFIVRDPGAIVIPLENNITRRWRVRALNQTFNSPWSTIATFITTRSCAGTALTFNGTDQRATDASFAWNGGPVTVEYWTYVKRSTLKASTTFMVGTGDNASNRFQVHAPWDDGVLYWDYGNVGDKGRIATAFGPYFDKWVHVALVSDGATFKAIYFNGQLANSATEASAPNNLTELTIGAMKTNTWFNGTVDEFRIWSVARSAEEIRSSMFRRLPAPAENTKIVGCWRLDEGTGTTSKDAVRARLLTLSSESMWTPSGASVTCEDVAPFVTPTFLSGVGASPLPRNHQNEVSWTSVNTQRGTVWYDLEVTNADGSRVVSHFNNITAASQSVAKHGLFGLPADSTMNVRVRARSAYTQSPWRQAEIVTQSPCESRGVVFTGAGERFTNTEFLFHGKAVTVEYWSLVNPDQLMAGVSFMVGAQDDESKRFQAHAPWVDKTYYWDYGNWGESGRISTSYEGSLGKWTHVALVSNGYDTMAIYLNGALVRRSSFADAPGILKQITIGGNSFSRTYHKGAMRDLRIWNVMRGQQQILNAMHQRIAEPQSNLLGSWLLDEGKGQRTTDVTGRSTDAVSGTEITWGDVPSPLMHAPAVIAGRRNVQRGDTAMYVMRAASNSTSQWTVLGGTLESSAVTNEIVVRWTGADTVGKISVARMWSSGCSDVTSYTIKLHTTLKVDEAHSSTLSSQITVHPNPASEKCSITWGGEESAQHLEVIDAQGRILFERSMSGNAAQIDMQSIANGTYTIRVSTASGTYTQRLLVHK